MRRTTSGPTAAKLSPTRVPPRAASSPRVRAPDIGEAALSAHRRILLGVTGGIAAAKAPFVVRRLRDEGCSVRVALTANGARFVSPLALEVLSGAAVLREEYLEATGSGTEGHVEASEWADVLCVAPCTTNTLVRLAWGLGDDFLTTTALMWRGPLVVAPAMHPAMWERPSTRRAVDRLKARGTHVLGPDRGPLASGESGVGRMVEPEAIASAARWARGELDYRGHRVVVSAGPTREALDPVRFLGNRSSGRMGFALAERAAARGAEVTLVAGPVGLPTPPDVERVDVESAEAMRDAVHGAAAGADLVVMAAAVADYRPRAASGDKLKKDEGVPAVELVPNDDILHALAEVAPRAVRVGFAAETRDLERNARRKLERKRAHFIVANDVSRSDIGFEAEDNEVVLFGDDGTETPISRAPKAGIAEALLDRFASRLAAADAGARCEPAEMETGR